MYADSSTDASHAPSVEHDSPRLPTSSSPPITASTPGSSYPPRSSSVQTNSQHPHPHPHPHSSNTNGTGAGHSPSVRSQSVGPHSPTNGMTNLNLRAGTPPSSLSPSPRQSEDIPFGIPVTQQQHHSLHGTHQPPRRNSMPRSVASGDKIPTQYAPTAELEDSSIQNGFDEGILRALCDLDVSAAQTVSTFEF